MKLSRRHLTVAVAAVVTATAGTVASLTLGAPAGAVPGCAATPDFDHSIPGPIGGPAAAATASGDVLFAANGGDRNLYVSAADISTTDLAVGPLACVVSGAVGSPAVVEYPGGTVLFVAAPNRKLYYKYAPDDGAETGWAVVPGSPVGVSSPTAVVSDGVLYVAVRVSAGNVAVAYRDLGSAGTAWSTWFSAGGAVLGAPAAFATATGAVTLVARATNGGIYATSGRTNAWGGGWQRLLAGTTSADPAVAVGFSPGRQDLFVTGTTGGLYQSTSSAASNGFFTAFKKIDASLPRGARIAAAGGNGRMIVYATVGPDVGYDQYVPGAGWLGFAQAPYTCADCLPVEGAAATRVVERTPLR